MASKDSKAAMPADTEKLTRQQLRELETKEKSKGQRILDRFIIALPFLCGLAAICEYCFIPNKSPNDNPYTYLGALIVLVLAYLCYGIFAAMKLTGGNEPLSAVVALAMLVPYYLALRLCRRWLGRSFVFTLESVN